MIFDKCKECCRSSSPIFGLKYKRSVFIGLFYVLLLIDISAAVIKCTSDSQCNKHECCAGYYDKKGEGRGKCKPKLNINKDCEGFIRRKKFISLPTGGVLFTRCGCKTGMTCKRIERKNWQKKKTFWSAKKKRIKTQYKYKCKFIPPEPPEIMERHR